jgi:two-component system cell cycle response regulator DivK
MVARVVRELKRTGAVVAMAGDGINDAGVTLVKGDLRGIVRAVARALTGYTRTNRAPDLRGGVALPSTGAGAIVGAPMVQAGRAARESATPLILVVDDTEDTRHLYAHVLEAAGYRVEQATNGQEALDMIAVDKPAVVLMDLSMPVMDGWEATTRIKGHPTTSDVVVIALTGHATELGLTRAKEAGADVICAKPCLPDVMLKHVRTMLGAI